MSKKVLVTGASSGIGLETAIMFRDKGYEVFGTSRDGAKAKKSLGQLVNNIEFVDLDLGDSNSIKKCIEQVGDVDILINNAGESFCSPLEETPIDELDRLFKVNVLGAVELTQKVLPSMRTKKSGTIVMVGSMLGSFPLAYRSAYVATKAAIKGFALSTVSEVKPYNIRMIVVEPGSINTGISTRRTKIIKNDSCYKKDFDTVINQLDLNEAKGISGRKVGELIMNVAIARNPKTFYAIGSNAPLMFFFKRVLPGDLIHKFTHKKHGLKV